MQAAAQLDLTLRPIARATDPRPSHAAARAMVRSGRLGRQLRATLAELARYAQPPTSHEMAGRDLGLRYAYARRLSDLETKTLVEKAGARACGITGNLASTWRLTAAGHAALALSGGGN